MWLKPRTEQPSELLPGQLRAPHSAAVFIDKDGTLVEDVPYNVDPAHLHFTPGALPAIRMLDQAGFELVVVTNQPGLALGRFSRADLAHLQKALFERVREEAGVELAGFYVCPHLPSTGFAPACLCRKPSPGLLRQAAMAHRYDMARSWMIGDILDDVEAGHRAGCRSILLDVGNETIWRLSPLRTPDFRCNNLLEAARIITNDAAAPDLHY
ncbi:MAG: D-glycero-alpha-D-manno-heptose-1,7-bisphosphate 7-phosphatase, partial [Betaproteobacteria bacterium]